MDGGESPARISFMRAAILLTLLVLGCGSASYDGSLHRSPLLRGEWDPLVARTSLPEESGDDRGSSSPVDLRERMTRRGLALLEDGNASGDYGAADLEPILADLLPDLGWSASSGLGTLVDKARSLDAYRTTGDPTKGDIALFNNQLDANGNGKLDDWLTGCGVVVGESGHAFEFVTRTGHAPRRAVAWPDGPSAATAGGEKINSFVRIPHRSDPPATRYLAGQLYAGHIDLGALARGLGE